MCLYVFFALWLRSELGNRYHKADPLPAAALRHRNRSLAEAALPGCHPGSDRQRLPLLDVQAHRPLLPARAQRAPHRDPHLRHQALSTRVPGVPLNPIRTRGSNRDLELHPVAGHRFHDRLLHVRLLRVHPGNDRRQSVQCSRDHLQIQACQLLDAIRRLHPRLAGVAAAYSQGDLRLLKNKLTTGPVHSDYRA